ncbi:hypothetical protein A4A49_26422 [Nicotiana attenuata]|uniref:Uncharacterized protein n=1 Tax=Nicotiana attenuata TaxID=49451 RepID=A0A1J6ITW7_NICAT|nr:hypothetical protein A4A49_26422 [Nicotiana attenuata]
MSGRNLILILFFWAVLTIVTPVLVRLSASAKANGEYFVMKHTSDIKEIIKDDKLMELLPRRALVAAVPPQKESMPPLVPESGPFPALARG